MTPKEKATQLCDAFYQKLPLERYVTTTDGDLSWEYNSWQRTKECALIAVDEIMEHIETSYYNEDIIKGAKSYWEEVKQNVENL
jgi:hypothetical protein